MPEILEQPTTEVDTRRANLIQGALLEALFRNDQGKQLDFLSKNRSEELRAYIEENSFMDDIDILTGLVEKYKSLSAKDLDINLSAVLENQEQVMNIDKQNG